MPGFSSLSAKDLASLSAYLFHPERASKASAPEPAARVASTSKDKPSRYLSGYGYMVTSTGLSSIRPPWTTLTEYDRGRYSRNPAARYRRMVVTSPSP